MPANVMFKVIALVALSAAPALGASPFSYRYFKQPRELQLDVGRVAVLGDDGFGARSALAMKSLPKMLTKFGDMISIQAERDAKVRAAVGADTAKKLKAYQVEEEDPFDFGGAFGMTFGD